MDWSQINSLLSSFGRVFCPSNKISNYSRKLFLRSEATSVTGLTGFPASSEPLCGSILAELLKFGARKALECCEQSCNAHSFWWACGSLEKRRPRKTSSEASESDRDHSELSWKPLTPHSGKESGGVLVLWKSE